MGTTHYSYTKNKIRQFLVDAMKDDPEIREIIVFGSFLHSDNPGDIDVAVRGTFHKGYLETAIRLRKKVHHIAKILPVDIIPIQEDAPQNPFMQEIRKGEVIYER